MLGETNLANLTQAGVIREKLASIETVPPPVSPIGQSLGLINESQERPRLTRQAVLDSILNQAKPQETSQ